MKNPWEEISLADYENHMKLDSVMQLQAMNEMMIGQFDTYSVSNIMILGIAGGNGLEHISKDKFERVYGVDVNSDYLNEVTRRYPDLEGILECLCINLLNETDKLPKSDMVIANLLIEYIGYECFQKAIQQADPKYVSCIIQINTEEDWVSNSPYLHVFDGLEQVHHQIEEYTLEKKMLEIDYYVIKSLEHGLPNGKKFVQMDFGRTTSSKKERGAARLSTRQKTYAFALLMIFLIVCTIFLSVKHEQKRMAEENTLQEEEPLEEMAVQAEEETVSIEADTMIGQEESVSIEEGTIIEADKHFTIIDAGEQTYPYTIYNADGEVVKSEVCYRIAPWIHYIDQETIEIHIGVGTETFYCVYYDIINDRFSEQYESPVAAEYHKVAFLDQRDDETVLVIRDMFDEKVFYKEFVRDFAAAVSPITYAVFRYEDTLLITYMASDFFESQKYTTELLFCGRSEEKEIPVCDIVRAMDFTAREPQLDITPEENQIYLEGYLKVLKNEIPVIGEVEVKYYKDLWKAGTEFEQLLKEKDTREYPYLYYYDDLDGDGKPEFAIEQGCMFLFKYDKELDQCRILHSEEACYFETIVGAGQIWRHDGMHANTVRDDLIGIVEDGSFQYILRLDEGVSPNHPYYQIGVSEAPTYDEYYVDVSEEEWNEITQPFFEMVENNALPRKTLEEVFGDLLEEPPFP